MDHAERCVAVLDLVDQDPNCIRVVDLADLRALTLHLLPDAVQVLRATGQLRLDARLLEHRPQRFDGTADERLAAFPPGVEHAGQLAVGLRLERLEGQILQFPLDAPDPEALGQRGVDLERLTSDASLLVRRQCVESAHVVEPVGQLDQDDPNVVGHGQEHLSDVLGLLFLVAMGAELRQLRDAIHELGHLCPEPLLDLGQGEVRVLGDIVQDGSRHRYRIDPDVGEDLRGGQRMGDVGLAGNAALAVVSHFRHLESGSKRRQVRLRVVVGYGVANVAESRLRSGQYDQSETQPIRQGQARRATPGFGFPGLGGRSGLFDRHWNESTSRSRQRRPRVANEFAGYRPSKDWRSIVPSSVTVSAPTLTEVKTNGLPWPAPMRVTVGSAVLSGTISSSPSRTTRRPGAACPLMVIFTMLGALSFTVA